MRVHAKKCFPKGPKLRYRRAFRISGPPPPRQAAGDSPRRSDPRICTKNKYFFYTRLLLKRTISTKFNKERRLTSRPSRSPTSVSTFDVVDLRPAHNRAVHNDLWVHVKTCDQGSSGGLWHGSPKYSGGLGMRPLSAHATDYCVSRTSPPRFWRNPLSTFYYLPFHYLLFDFAREFHPS